MYDVKPVTTPHATACGPACLKMLLRYYGQDVDLDTLIRECGVTINGCSAADLIRVGRAHGLDNIHAYRITTLDSLLKQDRPGILWWEYTHFVVFCGLDDNGEPVICNPSSGRYPINAATLTRKFTDGIAICNGRPQNTIDTEDYFGEHTPEPDYFDE